MGASNRSHRSRTSKAFTTATGLSGTSGLLMFDNGQRKPVPRLGSSCSSVVSSASMLGLRQEIGAAVQEEVAKAVRPLTERLEVERAARQRAEALLAQGGGAPLLA